MKNGVKGEQEGRKRGTHLTGCVQDLQHDGHVLVLKHLLVPILDGRIVLKITRNKLTTELVTHESSQRQVPNSAAMGLSVAPKSVPRLASS